MHPVRVARHYGQLALRRAFPSAREAAWRWLLEYAERSPGVGKHHARLVDLDIEFPVASALASQWHEIFVRDGLDVHLDSASPRILDCGAHVGLASLWCKRRWPSARITAFEPDPTIASMLRANLTRNGAGDVDVVEAAVSNHEGRARFSASGDDAGTLLGAGPADVSANRDVAVVTLRPWLNERVDLLKLDVEGAELDVLENCADLLSRVQAIHLEVHEFDASRRLLPRALLVLEEAGFTYALSDLARATWRPGVRPEGPFADTVTAWVVAVRAWRR